MLVTREQINKLLSYKPNGSPVLSFYLNTDRSQMPLQRIQSIARRKIHEAEEYLRRSDDWGRFYPVIQKEIARIQDYVYRHLPEHTEPGLVVFAGHNGILWEVFDLPRPVSSRLMVDLTPYFNPLLAILSEYSRFGVVLLDRQRARLLELYMGQLGELWDVFDDVPQKVSAGGWYGLRERKEQRKVEGKITHHFKHVAEELFRLFQKNQFDKLVVGCSTEYYNEFIRHLHPFLHKRLAGHLVAGPDQDIPEIIQKMREFERAIKHQEDQELINSILLEPRQPELVSFGLDSVSENVAMGKASLLLIAEGQSRSGRACLDCGWVSERAERCRICESETISREDVLEDLVEVAARQNCRIRFVEAATELDKVGGVATQLRYRISLPAESEKSG